MKSVCNLHGLRSSPIGRLGIRAGAVTTDKAEVRMGTQPALDCGAAPIREQIHHLVGLQIDDHRPRGRAFTKGKIIDPNLGRDWQSGGQFLPNCRRRDVTEVGR